MAPTLMTQTRLRRKAAAAPQISERRLLWVLLLPAVLFMLVVIGFPMLYSFYLSFTNYSLSSTTHKLIGFENYAIFCSTTRFSGRRSGAPCCS